MDAPYDLAAEEAVLDGLLLTPHRLADVRTVGLSRQHFYRPFHGEVFEVIQEIDCQGRVPDLVTVADALRRRGGRDEAVDVLTMRTPRSANIVEHAEIVRRLAQDRAIAGAIEAYANTNGEAARTAAIERLREVLGADGTQFADGRVDALRAALVHGDDIRKVPAPSPLIDGLVDLDTVALLYGPSGSGKTFVVLDWSLSVANGRQWMGHDVASGPVLYVVAEGLSGIGARVEAWQAQSEVWECGQLSFLPETLNLLERDSVTAAATLAGEMKARLVVIDTLARCMVGGDENTARDAGLAVEAAEQLRRASGACVLLVHHTGKDEAAGARGSSALRAAVATEIECRQSDGVVVLRVTKQREHAGCEPIHLEIVPVGESCALERHRASEDIPKLALTLLAELEAIDDGEGVSSTVWEASAGLARRSFFRMRKLLLEEGLCQRQGERAQARYRVSDQGKDELKGEE